MPIVVQHSPSFPVVGQAAISAGYGGYVQEQERFAAQLRQQAIENQQRRQAMQMDAASRQQSQAVQAYERDAGRQQELRMFGLQQQARAQEQAASAENQQTFQDRGFEQQRQMADQRAEQEREQWDYQWTAKQKAEIGRLNNYEQSIRSSPQLDPREKEMMLLELEGQRAGFRPMAIPKQKQDTVQEKIDGGGIGLWTHPQTGQQVPLAVDRSGALRNIDVPETPEQKARAEQIKQSSMEYKAQLDGWKIKLDWLKERREYIRDRVDDLTLVGEEGDGAPAMGRDKARQLAEQEANSLIPQPPEFQPPPVPAQAGRPPQQAPMQQPVVGATQQPAPAAQPPSAPMPEVRPEAAAEFKAISDLLNKLRQQYPDLKKAPLDVRKRVRDLMQHASLYQQVGL